MDTFLTNKEESTRITKKCIIIQKHDRQLYDIFNEESLLQQHKRT